MKAKSNKQSKDSPKHRPAIKDIPPKGNPKGGMGNVGGGGGTTPSRLLDP